MLTDKEMHAHLKKLRIPADGIDYVMNVRSSPPQRRVEGRRRLVSPVRYASQTMTHVIQGEGYTLEGYLVLQFEHDNRSVLEFWDQPNSISIEGTRADGKKLRTRYTPDYLVIGRAGVLIYEAKAVAELDQLCDSRPDDWILLEGNYHYRPAEVVFESLGLTHVVVPSTTYNAVHAENLSLLIHARRSGHKDTAPHKLEVARRYLKKHKVATMEQLSKAVRDDDCTSFIKWIDEGILFADLRTTRLVDPASVHIALDQVAVDACIAMRASMSVNLESDDGGAVARDKHLVVGMERLRVLNGEMPATKSLRTLQRWRKKLRESGGDPRSQIPDYRKCGSSGPKVSNEVVTNIKAFINQYFASENRPSERGAYRSYLAAIEDKSEAINHSKPVAPNTFRKIRKLLDPQQVGFARGGRRLANAEAPPTDPTKRSLPASRPFQRAHIDHYLCKQWVVVSKAENLIYVQRPWLTLMTCENSGKVLGMHLGFSHPGRASIAMALRDCVRRYHRLPELIISDLGVEFMSTYYEMALAYFGVHKQERPSGAPRFGGIHERRFGSLSSEVFAGLPGSMLRIQESRKISASHHGRKTATCSLRDLYLRIQSYVEDHYDSHPHGENLEAPQVIFDRGMRTFSCSGVPVAYDHTFLVATAIPANRDSYRVDPVRGVRVFGRHFRCNELVGSRARHVDDVKLEICDQNRIYVHFGKKWHTAYHGAPVTTLARDPLSVSCESITRLEGRTAFSQAKREREIDLARTMSRIDEVELARNSTPDSSSMEGEGRKEKNHQRRTRKVRPYRLTEEALQ